MWIALGYPKAGDMVDIELEPLDFRLKNCSNKMVDDAES